MYVCLFKVDHFTSVAVISVWYRLGTVSAVLVVKDWYLIMVYCITSFSIVVSDRCI